MNQHDTDLMLARAQIGLAFMFSVGFFGLLFTLMLFSRQMSPTTLTILTGLVSVLGTLLALMMNFFFARTRPAALPDPTTTSSTTTTTTGPSPTIVPAGATLVPAPGAPAAIIPADPAATPGVPNAPNPTPPPIVHGPGPGAPV